MPDKVFTPVDPNFAERVRASFARQTFMRTLGVTVTLLEPGRCELTMPFHPGFCQQHGYLHAGVVTSVSDSACGYAAYSLMPADSSVLSIEFKQNLLAPAIGETLIARAAVIRSGRNISVAQADAYVVRQGVEKQIGVMTATLMCLHGSSDT